MIFVVILIFYQLWKFTKYFPNPFINTYPPNLEINSPHDNFMLIKTGVDIFNILISYRILHRFITN